MDHQRFPFDYQLNGIRECISEVSRYLGTVEGMSMEDPLRIRLMSHLQCFMTQKELSARSNSTLISSTYSSCPPPLPIYPTYSNQNIVSQNNPQLVRPFNSDIEALTTQSQNCLVRPLTNVQHNNASHTNYELVSPTLEHHHGSTYLDLSNNRMNSSSYNASYNESYSPSSVYNNNSTKPYRPWGTEMAY